RANLVMIDVQPDQRQAVTDVLEEQGVNTGTMVPMVPMRIAAVNDQNVAEIVGRGGSVARDSLDEDNGGGLWAWRREYRSSYRDKLGDSERLVAGRWFEESDSGNGRSSDTPVAIS